MTGRTAATCFILAALGLQLVAGFKLLAPPRRFEALQPLHLAPSPALWPFLDYDMYSGSRGEGDYGQRYVLLAVDAAGAERELTQDDFGFGWRQYRDEVLYPVRDGHDGAAERAAAWLEARGAARPASFRVDGERLVLRHDGLEVAPRRVLRVARVGAAP